MPLYIPVAGPDRSTSPRMLVPLANNDRVFRKRSNARPFGLRRTSLYAA